MELAIESQCYLRSANFAVCSQDVMLRLPVFNRYPESVRQDLARTMWYDRFTDGRVIVRQGDPGTRMYFIVSGEVDFKRTDQIDSGWHLVVCGFC